MKSPTAVLQNMPYEKEIKLALQIIVAAVVCFILWRVGSKWYKNYKLNQALKLYKDSEVKTDSGVVINTASVATEIHDAFYNNDWLGFSENEQAAIDALQGVPKEFIPRLEENYKTLFNKDLRADFNKFLEYDQYQSIKYLFQ